MAQIVVAIPVRDEAALIQDCLRALALQHGPYKPNIVLLVNNSRDGTADIARAMKPTLPCVLHVIEHEFRADQANAGEARRLAMQHAADLTDAGGLVMTTDADGCVAPDWLEANLAAFEAGADVVCGRAVIDPIDALRIPTHLHEDDRHEVAYGSALDRIGAMLDPDPADPWLRHTEESGASIAVRLESFLEAGGVPAIPSGEDRALVEALRRIDARIRHDPYVSVTVSGRTEGRATAGMADTIRRRLKQQDAAIDSSMEPVADRLRRISARRLLRLCWGYPEQSGQVENHICEELRIDRKTFRALLAQPTFGAAWASAEATSPNLVRKPVLREDLHRQMNAACVILGRLRDSAAVAPLTGGRMSRPKVLPDEPSVI